MDADMAIETKISLFSRDETARGAELIVEQSEPLMAGALSRLALHCDCNVLIVDDMPPVRGVLRKILEKIGCTVVGEAADGAEAVKLAEELRPDVITMDVDMAGMGGIAASKAILRVSREITIVFVTSSISPSQLIECMRAGVRNIIHKPFEIESIAHVIRHAMGDSAA